MYSEMLKTRFGQYLRANAFGPTCRAWAGKHRQLIRVTHLPDSTRRCTRSLSLTTTLMDRQDDFPTGYQKLSVVDDPNSTLLEEEFGGSPRPLSAKEERTSRIQFYSLCWSLFVIGWNDGSTGPLLPRIHEVYKVGFTTIYTSF